MLTPLISNNEYVITLLVLNWITVSRTVVRFRQCNACLHARFADSVGENFRVTCRRKNEREYQYCSTDQFYNSSSHQRTISFSVSGKVTKYTFTNSTQRLIISDVHLPSVAPSNVELGSFDVSTRQVTLLISKKGEGHLADAYIITCKTKEDIINSECKKEKIIRSDTFRKTFRAKSPVLAWGARYKFFVKAISAGNESKYSAASDWFTQMEVPRKVAESKVEESKDKTGILISLMADPNSITNSYLITCTVDSNHSCGGREIYASIDATTVYMWRYIDLPYSTRYKLTVQTACSGRLSETITIYYSQHIKPTPQPPTTAPSPCSCDGMVILSTWSFMLLMFVAGGISVGAFLTNIFLLNRRKRRKK